MPRREYARSSLRLVLRVSAQKKRSSMPKEKRGSPRSAKIEIPVILADLLLQEFLVAEKYAVLIKEID